MNTQPKSRATDDDDHAAVKELELTDLDIDQQLLTATGTSLLVFSSVGCASCRWARQQLPGWRLPVERICWIDAGRNGGANERYQVLHLPALFVVDEGQFHGQLHTRLTAHDLCDAVHQALARNPEDLP